MTDDEERLKLAWEVAVMDLPIDRARADIEKIRQGFDKTRLEIYKIRPTWRSIRAASGFSYGELWQPRLPP